MLIIPKTKSSDRYGSQQCWKVVNKLSKTDESRNTRLSIFLKKYENNYQKKILGKVKSIGL